jgi:hypothetical protein
LRDHGGAEQVVLAQAAFGDGQKKLIGHLQLGRDVSPRLLALKFWSHANNQRSRLYNLR